MSEKSTEWPDGAVAGLADCPDEVLVRCPRCAGAATSRPRPRDEERRPYEANAGNRQLTCHACGDLRYWQPRPMHVDRQAAVGSTPRQVPAGPVDAYFGLPLLLQTDCRERVLWAYNAAHLDALVPTWTSLASNGAETIRAIARLRGLLPARSGAAVA